MQKLNSSQKGVIDKERSLQTGALFFAQQVWNFFVEKVQSAA